MGPFVARPLHLPVLGMSLRKGGKGNEKQTRSRPLPPHPRRRPIGPRSAHARPFRRSEAAGAQSLEVAPPTPPRAEALGRSHLRRSQLRGWGVGPDTLPRAGPTTVSRPGPSFLPPKAPPLPNEAAPTLPAATPHFASLCGLARCSLPGGGRPWQGLMRGPLLLAATFLSLRGSAEPKSPRPGSWP